MNNLIHVIYNIHKFKNLKDLIYYNIMKLFVCSLKKSKIDTLLKEKINVLELNILLRGGKYIWDDSDNTNYSREYIIKEYLESNDIYYTDLWMNDSNPEEIYVLVDNSLTNCDNFYKDNEIEKDDEYILCWKKIYLFLNEDGNDFLGTNISYFDNDILNSMSSIFIKYIFNKYIKSK
jgi:hypothetical protein